MTKNLSSLIVSATSAVLLFAATAQSQQVPGRSVNTTPPAPTQMTAQTAAQTTTASTKPVWLLGDDAELVRVALNKVVSVRLPGEVRNVIVANPDVADIILPEDGARTHVYILAREVGSTAIIFEDIDGNILFQGDIQVDVDVTGIRAALSKLMGDEKIQVSSQRNGVFLTGFVRSAGTSAQAIDIARRFVPDNLDIINNMEVLGSRQVMMQVRVSEIRRTSLKQFGLDFTYSANLGASSFSITSGGGSSSLGVPSAFATGSILPAITGFGSIAYRVLEQNNLANTLAEPTLTAISGETASFLAGGSFPMPVAIDTNGTVTYEQQPYGVRLNFTPTVLDNGQISLHVATEVSDIDTTVTVNGFPGLSVKRTETIVDLPSGGSMMISGLIQNEVANVSDGVPGLRNIPVLGALFRSDQFRNEETELIITVTAYLSEPVGNDARLALPTDGFAAPSELDFYLLGNLHRRYTKVELPPYATPLAGPYGYIME